MKITKIILAAFAATAFASGQTASSDVVGYVTESIQPGFNLVGITLHNKVEFSSSFTGVSGTTLSDSANDFSALTGTFILEVTSGDASGTIQEITSFTTNGFSTPEDLSSEITTGDTYTLRKAQTIGDVFGEGDDVVFNKGNSDTGDLLYVPNASGGFDIYFHTPDSFLGAGSWDGVGDAEGGADRVLIYADAMFIQNRGTESYNLTFSGAVKSSSTQLLISEDFTYVTNPYPAGTTLDSSGLAEVIGRGNSETADLVFIPNTTGGFDIFFHTPDSFLGAGSWDAIGDVTTGGQTELTGGIIIQRKGETFTTNSQAPSI